MNENIIKQLKSRIITKLSGIKPFIEICNFGDSKLPLKIYNNDIEYERGNISISIQEITHELDNYHLVTYLLDSIILELTMCVTTKNHYISKDTLSDITSVIYEQDNINWFMTHSTQMEYLELMDLKTGNGDWSKFVINNKRINLIESTFPKSVIFGSEYPLLIDPNTLNVNLYDDENISIINIPYYYIDDFHAVRLITDENQRKMFLRNKKIKKLGF